MIPLTTFPASGRLLAGAIAVMLVLGATYATGRSHGAASVQAKWDAVALVLADQAKRAEAEARANEQSMNHTYQEAINAALERETRLRADYAAAHAAAVGLRDTVAAIRRGLPADSAEACRNTADTALAVFGECADRYQRLAEAADSHANDAQLCRDAWPE